mmetsp:Transcript_14403/g.17623  ORF Transcript_14403/g.17623 Transcript_14403/m.17623 type:complete len:87 (-) Transcript_14403:1038-1298(-)
MGQLIHQRTKGERLNTTIPQTTELSLVQGSGILENYCTDDVVQFLLFCLNTSAEYEIYQNNKTNSSYYAIKFFPHLPLVFGNRPRW